MKGTWIGIDVSKERLDAAVLGESGRYRERSFANDRAGRAALLAWALASGDAEGFCLESTGPYSLPLALLLAQAGERVSVEDPRRVRHYGHALGLLNKTDRADARLLARYGRDISHRAWCPPPPELSRLAALDRRLTDLEGLTNREVNRLEAEAPDALAEASVRRTLAFLKEERARVEGELAAHVEAHPALREDVELLQSVPGVGPRAAVGFLAETAGKEFASAEQVAAYAGLCPRRSQSGAQEAPARMSKRGNARLRARFYMPAVVAKTHNPIVKAHYERLVENDKPKKAAVIACMRKLLMICHAVLRTRTPFDPAKALT